MQSPDDAGTGKAARPARGAGTTPAGDLAGDPATTASRQPSLDSAAPPVGLGPETATILATEHWSLLGTRSMLWNEAMSRTTVFLTVLSAAVVSLALVASATGFGHRTTTLALALLPVVLFLGVATHLRLVQINAQELGTVLAMNRLRHAYLTLAPGLEPYFTAGHHDDWRGVATTYLLGTGGWPRRRSGSWAQLLVTTPTIVATINAAIATAIVVLAMQAAKTPTAAVVAAGAVAFLATWAALFALQRPNLTVLDRTTARFPTPPNQ
jgi:hypothetical protein